MELAISLFELWYIAGFHYHVFEKLEFHTALNFGFLFVRFFLIFSFLTPAI